MSRIGKKEIPIPDNVNVDINGNIISVKGPLGEDSIQLISGIGAELGGNKVTIVKKNSDDNSKSINGFYGLSRSLLSNIIRGVSEGFEKDLEIMGVGYRATQQGEKIQFQLGFSHDIVFSPPEGISLLVVDATNVKVKGINKQKVGQVAADIRKLRPPEPYKGKGIRYKSEYVRKKAGKTGK